VGRFFNIGIANSNLPCIKAILNTKKGIAYNSEGIEPLHFFFFAVDSIPQKSSKNTLQQTLFTKKGSQCGYHFFCEEVTPSDN